MGTESAQIVEVAKGCQLDSWPGTIKKEADQMHTD